MGNLNYNSHNLYCNGGSFGSAVSINGLLNAANTASVVHTTRINTSHYYYYDPYGTTDFRYDSDIAEYTTTVFIPTTAHCDIDYYPVYDSPTIIEGSIRVIVNMGTYNIVLKNQTSTTDGMFSLPSDYTLTPYKSAIIQYLYDDIEGTEAWFVIGGT